MQEVKDLDPPGSTTYASQQCNEAKNRYINILACELSSNWEPWAVAV